MIVDISKITLNNIKDYEEERYHKQVKDKKSKLLDLLQQKQYVTPQDIKEKVYKNKNVTRQTIGQLIRRLRDDGHNIKTVSKVGYTLCDNLELLEGGLNVKNKR